jgi:hypothetical protein
LPATSAATAKRHAAQDRLWRAEQAVQQHLDAQGISTLHATRADGLRVLIGPDAISYLVVPIAPRAPGSAGRDVVAIVSEGGSVQLVEVAPCTT